MQYGKSNYEKPKFDNERTPIYKLSGGGKKPVKELILRFAPPVKELRDNPKGYRKMHSVHWGYGFTVQKKDGTSVFLPQNFECVREYDSNGNISQECPECQWIYSVLGETEAEKARLKADGRTDEDIREILKPKTDWLFKHSKDRKVYWLAKNLEGKWGYALFPKQTSELLEVKLAELQSRGIDPLSPENGVWFRIYRVDEKNNNVDVVMENAAGGLLKYKTDTFTQADDDALEKIPGLLQATTKITLDQVRDLVNSKGDENIARLIFNKGRPARNDTAGLATNQVVATVQAPVVTTSAATPAVEVVAPVAHGVDDVAAYLSQFGIKTS